MSVLGRDELLSRIKRKPDDPLGLIVAPLLQAKDQIGEDCIDVHLGNYFIETKRRGFVAYDVRAPLEAHQELVHVPFGDEIVLPAGESILGMVYEYIKTPVNVAGEVLTRSKYGRLFVTIATATWIHPGFRGCLTLEILNSSGAPVRIFPGMRVGQLVFYGVTETATSEKPLSGLAGRTRPHFPTFTEEVEHLRRLGVPKRDGA